MMRFLLGWPIFIAFSLLIITGGIICFIKHRSVFFLVWFTVSISWICFVPAAWLLLSVFAEAGPEISAFIFFTLLIFIIFSIVYCSVSLKKKVRTAYIVWLTSSVSFVILPLLILGFNFLHAAIFGGDPFP